MSDLVVCWTQGHGDPDHCAEHGDFTTSIYQHVADLHGMTPEQYDAQLPLGWEGHIAGPSAPLSDPTYGQTLESQLAALKGRSVSDLRAAAAGMHQRAEACKAMPALFAYEELVYDLLALIDAHQCYDVDALERAMREHILDSEVGWPHLREHSDGRGAYGIDGCNDLCAAAIIARLHEA